MATRKKMTASSSAKSTSVKKTKRVSKTSKTKPKENFSVASVAKDLRGHIDPMASVAERLKNRVSMPPKVWQGNALPQALKVQPIFTEPSYEMLVEENKEFLMPGAGEVEENTVALLAVNQSFIESFLLGLNHELSREFLWREFPTELDGTWMKKFWDHVDESKEDIAAIDKWKDKAKLGKQSAVGKSSLVLFIKGELIRRYPDAIIYAVPARWSKGKRVVDENQEEKHPIFSGDLDEGSVFLGFDLEVADARGNVDPKEKDAGYFFVIEEHPSAPRFGLDEPGEKDFKTNPQLIEDLSWGHLTNSQSKLNALTHAPLNSRLKKVEDCRWGSSSVDMAHMTYQRPMRLLFHVDSMLPDLLAEKSVKKSVKKVTKTKSKKKAAIKSTKKTTKSTVLKRKSTKKTSKKPVKKKTSSKKKSRRKTKKRPTRKVIRKRR